MIPILLLKEIYPLEHEVWKPITGYEHYQVSNLGNVRNKKGELKKPSISDWGYRTVVLHDRGRRSHNLLVCILVCNAFNSSKPFAGAKCRHLDDNKLNDRWDNLAWGTHQDNMNDRGANGHKATGDTHGSSVLNSEQVREIRRLKNEGTSQAALSRQFNVGEACISNIIRRRTWKDLT
jgi:hypothetical protein